MKATALASGELTGSCPTERFHGAFAASVEHIDVDARASALERKIRMNEIIAPIVGNPRWTAHAALEFAERSLREAGLEQAEVDEALRSKRAIIVGFPIDELRREHELIVSSRRFAARPEISQRPEDRPTRPGRS